MSNCKLYQDDLPPEYCQYRDEGCDLAPACLECPLPTCIYDLPRGKQKRRSELRSEGIATLRAQGRSTREIAQAFGVSTRTVQRILSRQRQAGCLVGSPCARLNHSSALRKERVETDQRGSKKTID